MSKREPIASGDEPSMHRFELYLEASDNELEHLTISRLVELARSGELAIPRDEVTELACRIYESRRIRARFLDNSMLGEPVWDMLLALYCLPAHGEALSVSGLCQAAGVPATTALRWVQLMEQKKLVRRKPDAADGRRSYIVLSEEGEQLMTAYLTTIHQKLAPR